MLDSWQNREPLEIAQLFRSERFICNKFPLTNVHLDRCKAAKTLAEREEILALVTVIGSAVRVDRLHRNYKRKENRFRYLNVADVSTWELSGNKSRYFVSWISQDVGIESTGQKLSIALFDRHWLGICTQGPNCADL